MSRHIIYATIRLEIDAKHQENLNQILEEMDYNFSYIDCGEFNNLSQSDIGKVSLEDFQRIIGSEIVSFNKENNNV